MYVYIVHMHTINFWPLWSFRKQFRYWLKTTFRDAQTYTLAELPRGDCPNFYRFFSSSRVSSLKSWPAWWHAIASARIGKGLKSSQFGWMQKQLFLIIRQIHRLRGGNVKRRRNHAGTCMILIYQMQIGQKGNLALTPIFSQSPGKLLWDENLAARR